MFTLTANDGSFYSLPVDKKGDNCIGVSFEDGKAFLGMTPTILELNKNDIDNLISVLEHVKDLIK